MRAAPIRMEFAPPERPNYKHAVILSTRTSISIYWLLLFLFIAIHQLEATKWQGLTTKNVVESDIKATLLGKTLDASNKKRSSPLDSFLRKRRKTPGQRETKTTPTQRKLQTKSNFTKLSPVILVPGYGGSRLEAKLNKQRVKHYLCHGHTSNWHNIWLDLKLMLPYMIDCLIDNFRLEFEPSTNTTHNTQGVDIRVSSPDDLATVEYLTEMHLSAFGYFAAIIRRLTKIFGYERNVNLRGAPYDFRKAPNELGEYFKQMRVICEQMYDESQGQPISFVCHSMGCNNVLYFLQGQSQAWKDQHVRRVVSLAAPWGGSMQAVRATAFGDNLGMPYLFDEAELKIVQQSVPSTMYLYPSERAFGQEPLIQTNTRPAVIVANKIDSAANDDPNETINKRAAGPEQETHTAGDFKRFFQQIQHPDGYLMWLNTKDLLRSLAAPGVEVNNFYGRGHSTLARMEFDGEFPNSRERDIYADGDGTVTVQSSTICREWAKEQSQPVTERAFYANHVEMTKDPDVLNAIEEIMGIQDLV